MKTKFAIGCLVQWYEVNIIGEYISSLKAAVDVYGSENVLIHFDIIQDQILEEFDGTEEEFEVLLDSLMDKITSLEGNYKVHWNCFNKYTQASNEVYSIADHRREFNERYCEKVDVLVWGESDMLVPLQAFTVLDHLHQNVQTPKYVATFSICKMWDASWKVLEHPKFTDKPFIENDYDNWWSLKYTMSIQEMNSINSETEQLELLATTQHKFNGCGLIISSEVIKAGVNIPSSVFFVHEDTAFMIIMNRLLESIPQYIIKNILVVHNRNHPKKRMYVKGESGETMNQKRRSNSWYIKANKYSEENCYNLFNPNYKSKTWKDVWK
jgi:hypothetical protein